MKETIVIQQEIEIEFQDDNGRLKAIEEIKKSSNWLAFCNGWTDYDKSKGITKYSGFKKDETIKIISHKVK